MALERVAVTWQPLPYMKKAVKFLLEHAAAGIFADPGLRKTSITLAALKVLKKQGLMHRTLIIAPLRVCYLVWPLEVQKWKDFNEFKVEVLHGPKKDQALAREADIYLINPEGLEWLFGVTHTRNKRGKVEMKIDMKRVKELGFDTLVVDESSKLKHVNTLRFKILKPLLPRFSRRWILTGSPAPNGLMDLFGQAYLLDLGNALGQFISHFRMKYFYPTGFGGFDWQLQKGADEEIYERLRPLVLRLDEKDYLELPEIIPNYIMVDLPPEARRVYDELEEEMISQFESGEILTVPTASVAASKCAQIANGGVYRTPIPGEPFSTDETAKWAHVHWAKAEALRDLLEELGGKQALIAYDFKHDLERILKLLGKDTPVMGSSMKKALDIEQRWNAGELSTLLGHPQSMGHGLNFQYGGCQHVIWHSLTYNQELWDQFVKRVRRSGNPHKRVFVHYIIARNTVDEAKMAAIRSKTKTQNAFLDAMKAYTQRRRAKGSQNVSKSEKFSLYTDDESDYSGLQGAEGSYEPNHTEEKIMTTTETVTGKSTKVGVTAKDATTETKATKGKPAAAAPATAKGAKGKPAAAAPAPKGKPAAAAPAPKTERVSKYAGKKIVVVNKKHEAREGTKRAMLLDAILTSKNSDEALAKDVDYKGEKVGVTANDLKFAIELGLIELK